LAGADHLAEAVLETIGQPTLVAPLELQEHFKSYVEVCGGEWLIIGTPRRPGRCQAFTSPDTAAEMPFAPRQQRTACGPSLRW
jgi:hypothetical protein